MRDPSLLPGTSEAAPQISVSLTVRSWRVSRAALSDVLRVRSLGKWHLLCPCLLWRFSFWGWLCHQPPSVRAGALGALQLLPGARAALPPTWAAGEFSLVLQTEMT